jgi:hypothetical protein
MDKKLACKIKYFNNQIHADEGPAITQYDKEGNLIYEGYYKYGIKLDKDFVENKKWLDIPVKKVLSETNNQYRMMLIRLIGLDKILEKANGVSLDISEDNQYELLSFKDIFPIEMRILKMRCPSTNNYYFIPVAPNCNNVESALNYYYGGIKYDFIKET